MALSGYCLANVEGLKSLPQETQRRALTPDERERMFTLCQQIATEKDQNKFVRLIHELNDLLERKEHRLENTNPSQPHQTSK